MTNVKCVRCGTLTTGTSQICKICEIELNPIRPSATGSVLFPSHQSHAGSYNSDTNPTRIRPFHGVSDVVTPTLVLFTKNFWLITKLTLVIVAPFEIFKVLSIPNSDDWQLTVGLYILDLMCSILIAPALIFALMQVMETGIAPGIHESYRWGFSKLGKLTVCAAISWILTMLGLVLCVIPGIIAAVSLSLVFPIAILEKGSPSEVLHSSLELTRGHRWNILGAYIVIAVLMLVFFVPAGLLVVYLGAQSPAFWPLQAAVAILGDILNQATVVFSLVTYLSIRALWSQSTQG